MSLKLSLGVIDVPEPYGHKSTAEVAELLEDQYGVFTSFAEYRGQEIADLIGVDAEKAIALMLDGKSVDVEAVFAPSGKKITKLLHHFFTSQEVETVGIANVPTKDALAGKSFKFDKGITARRWVKKGLRGGGREYTKRNPRPSFIFSGVFEASLKAEIK